jgi:ABC-type sugar transport system substrate-binding protein
LVRGEPGSPKSDIYSLGVILYHMLAGRPPFEQSDAGVLALLYQHVEEEPPSIRKINPSVPPPVEAVVMQALKKNPDQRYKSAEAMVLDLNATIGRRISTISYPALPVDILPTPLHILRRWRRNRLLWMTALVLALLIGGGLLLNYATNQSRVASILPGVHGTIETVIPSDSEIALAHERLGQSGFIAYIACTLNSVFQAGRARDIADIADQYGLPYRIFNSQSDAYTQITLIEQARLEGARAFILCPLSTDSLNETIISLQEANIPVVFTTLYDHPYGVKLDTDSDEIGLRMGRYTRQIIEEKWNGEATVLILAFPGFPASDARTSGIQEALGEIAPQVSILPQVQGFTREEAYIAVRELLQQGTETDIIVTINDAGAIGAVDALQEAGIPPNAVDIVSANAELPVLDLIREGLYVRGTVAINREQLSRLAVYGAIKQLAGATVPEFFDYPPGDMITAETLAAQFPE